MAKEFACALTHVRNESFFLEKWLSYYGALFGRENLYVVIDGSDWTPDVDLEGVNVEIVEDAPRRRIKNDRWAAKLMSGRANKLRKTYNYVIRGDVDEFVAVDPNCGMSWEQALSETDEDGYSYALGIDVVEAPEENILDRTQPVLGQRRHGFISDKYSKPFVISRWNNWTGGAHRLINRPVKINPKFKLFHLALADQGIVEERWLARGGQNLHFSFEGHTATRNAAFDLAAALDPEPFDEISELACAQFPFEEDGSEAKRPRAFRDARATEPGILTEIPERFFSLL
ncbi:glycosyltransferase family 2 protein [Celeribacter sp. ULVN23_4]